MSAYVGNSFAATFEAAPGLTPDQVQKVLIVIIMFCAFWTVGLTIIFGCSYRMTRMTKQRDMEDAKNIQRIKKAETSRSPAAIYETMTNYINSVFPAVFSPISTFQSFKEELKRNHRYLTLMTAPPGRKGDFKRILVGIQLLTNQTLLIFLLAVFYDLQGPTDNGTCVNYYTQSSCLARKSVFDSKLSYCLTCSFRDVKISFKAAFYAAVLVSICSSLVSRPVDYLFDLLSAPTVDSIKAKLHESRLQKIGKQVSSAMRRASTAAANILNRAIGSTITTTTNNNTGGGVEQEQLEEEDVKAGPDFRDIPEEVQELHYLAHSSLAVIGE
jgi:hypothetical protein